MKSCSLMRDVCEKLAAKHGVDLYKPGAFLRLEMPPYEPLVIECVMANVVVVTHYTVGYPPDEAIADPDVEFYTGYPDPTQSGKRLWAPLAIQQILGYYRYITLKDGQPDTVDAVGQADLAAFANTWARNIRAQGWLDKSTRKTLKELLDE